MKLITCVLIILGVAVTKNPHASSYTQTVSMQVQIGDEVVPERIEIALFGKDCPLTVRNFYELCTKQTEKDGIKMGYLNTIFHRIIPNFMI